MTSPLDWLRQVEKILDPVFVPLGYRFELGALQKGSGGEFAFGYSRKGDQSVELHVIADDCLSHKAAV